MMYNTGLHDNLKNMARYVWTVGETEIFLSIIDFKNHGDIRPEAAEKFSCYRELRAEMRERSFQEPNGKYDAGNTGSLSRWAI